MTKYLSKFLYFFWLFIKTLLLTYAVAFSLAGTALIVYGYVLITKPFKDVKYLIDHNPAQTEYMKQYRVSLRAQKKPDTLQQRFVRLDSISKFLQNTVIASEDDGFYTHPGFDIEAILAAVKYNRDKNRIVRGASTITQQLAKNLFCDHEKSFMRKFKEMGYTLLLEKYLDKDRILELYLNYAQWGDNIFGCEAASQQYFKKPCSKLSINEASRLAATLAMPSRLSPLNDKSVFIQKRVTVMANNLYRRHMLDDSGYTALSGLPPPKDSLADSTTATDMTASVAPALNHYPAKYSEREKMKNGNKK
jgi:monofunctional biosynthetic peptidoglycan transglycosylase